MPQIISQYVAFVEAVNYRLGRIVMYGIFLMVGVLLWSSISKTFFSPSLWTLETAQFVMVAYYILGGPYSIQLGSNVRMDLFYSPWSERTKAWADAFTDLLRGELIQCDSFYFRNNDLPSQLIWYSLHFFIIPDSGEVVVGSNYAAVNTQDLIYT